LTGPQRSAVVRSRIVFVAKLVNTLVERSSDLSNPYEIEIKDKMSIKEWALKSEILENDLECQNFHQPRFSTLSPPVKENMKDDNFATASQSSVA